MTKNIDIPSCPICKSTFTCWCSKHSRWECYKDDGFIKDRKLQTHIQG